MTALTTILPRIEKRRRTAREQGANREIGVSLATKCSRSPLIGHRSLPIAARASRNDTWECFFFAFAFAFHFSSLVCWTDRRGRGSIPRRGSSFSPFLFFQTTLRGFRKYKTKWEKYRLKGGIEPLRLSSATGLKPALRTTEDHQGEKRVSVRVANFVENIAGRYLWLVVKPHLI